MSGGKKMLTDLVLKLIDSPKDKTILEVGAHDDAESVELAGHFKKVFAYYEYSKIPERTAGNLEIRKTPFLEVLKKLNEFDVLLMENEFHHFPDIWQMWTYDRLQANQELLIVEWNGKGNDNDFYNCFQNCAPLCDLTKEIMEKFILNGSVRLVQKIEGRDEIIIKTKENIISHYKFMLPDHWRFGETDFMKKIQNLSYPINVWEGFNVYKIMKA